MVCPGMRGRIDEARALREELEAERTARREGSETARTAPLS